MRKALILTVLALFGSESLAQSSFRHAPTVALDDVQDNNMMMMMKFERPAGSPPPFNPSSRFDDVQDNEMALQGAINEALKHYGNAHRINFDDIEDDEQEQLRRGKPINGGPIPQDSFRNDNPSFLGSGNSGVFAQGGRAPQGGVQFGGSGQLTGPIGNSGAQYMVGGTFSHSPGGPGSFSPHVGVSIPF